MILFFGDVHGEFKHVQTAVNQHKPAAIILLGDLEASKPLEALLATTMKMLDGQVYFIHGNHDTDKQAYYDNLFGSAMAGNNLHGKVTEIDGLLVAGLGGIFRSEIWHPEQLLNAGRDFTDANFMSFQEFAQNQQEKYHWHQNAKTEHIESRLLKHKSSIFFEDWYELSQQKCNLLVTHEAPSCHPYGFRAIDALAREMHAETTFHGHHHDRLNYASSFNKLGFKAYGVGYRCVSDLHGNVLLDGLYDQRSNKHSSISHTQIDILFESKK